MTERSCRRLLAALVVWCLAACAWFAAVEPTSKRYWDERYSVSNVENVLVNRTLRSENGWYGRLSYLPPAALLAGVEALHRATGIERLAVLREQGGFTPSAYLIARLLTVLYGAGALILTFAIGRRIFGPRVALLGVVLLASSPWVLRHFVTFKPDALLLLLVLATFHWSLEAAERPSVRAFVLAGLGVGLAASAKFTGALAAIPVISAALVATDRWRLRVARLAAAGATSIAVFLIVQPDLGFYLEFLRRQDRFYSARASHSFGSMLASELADLLHWSFHGPWVGAVALAGLAALGVRLARLAGAKSPGRRLGHLAAFVSFPLGFSLLYALATTWPKGNNYLVIVPFTSLAAAWLLHALWAWAAERAPERVRAPALGLALGGLLLLTFWPANAYIHAETVPTTLDRVGEKIREMSPALGARRLVVESGPEPPDLSSGRGVRSERALVREVESLTELSETDLDLADFELFGEDRLDGERADFYRQRIGRLESGAVARVRPAWFRAVGPAHVLLVHPWSQLGRPLEVEWRRQRPAKGRYLGRLPRGVRAGQAVSIEARLPRHATGLTGVRVGDLELPLGWVGSDEYGERFATARFLLPAPDLQVRMRWAAGAGAGHAPRVVVVRWASSIGSPPPDTRLGE